MATTNLKNDRQQPATNWQYKISGVDIELKEKQFLNDEFEYYKDVKTKPKKKNTRVEDRRAGFLVDMKVRPRHKLF